MLSTSVVLATLAWSLGIAVFSVLLAWPGAWCLGRLGKRAWPWAVVPLTMPTYLAYAGYGLLRAPGTRLGDWLETAAHEGWPAAPVVAGKALAFIGMGLWCWPIPALLLGWAVARLDPGMLESLRMEGGSAWRRWLVPIRAMARPLVGSISLIALLTLGSAVPLHLAQAETWSIKLWFALDNIPWEARWRVWMLASPLMLAGGVAAWCVCGAAMKGSIQSDQPGRLPRVSITSAGGGIVVWLLSTAAPLALFASSLRQSRSLVEFWRVNDEAVAWSCLVAGLVAMVSMAICASAWVLSSRGSSGGLVRVGTTLLGAAGLAPGVVVGAVVNEAWSTWEQTRAVGDSYWIVVLAHIARFGWLAALVGLLLAALEPKERRAQRALDGATSLRGWWQASGRPAGGLVVATGVMVGLLSLHEIESTVMVQPPGIDGLARRLLQFLHFSRMEDLSAAGVWLIGGGLAVALLVALAASVIGKGSER